jgi:hypothetical protein
VFLQCRVEPIDDGGELDEGEEVEGSLLVANADAEEAFEELEEVLHPVADPVEAQGNLSWVLALL